ncbi:cytochrome P450 [Helicobacter burdigaliensis]|uniref:cytochrome P450 n=1 Tax=Helicobacter burdigaliensis TaxID=2315334 RepID=UPI000EF6E797|nr:cytochrome P450 [Helicobacter burdigaliensis]
MGECPFFPAPHKNKASLLVTFLLKRRSWLDGLYERSYKMKSGRVKMPGFDLVIANHPKDVRRIMVDEVKEFPKSQLLHELLSPLLGESIFTTNGEVWKRQRELLRPSFEQARITKVFSLMHEAVFDMMQKIENLSAKNNILEVDEIMTFVTADVIFRTIMSEKLDELRGKAVLDAFVTFQEQTVHRAIHKMFCLPKWVSMLLGEYKRIRAGNTIRKVLADIIKPRYEAYKEGDSTYSDILSSLLAVVDVDTKKRFGFEEILDQVAMLFLAGHETSASSLTWALYLLSLNQKEQELAYKEIISINPSGDFDILNLRALKYLNNVFKESLRLYPPVGFFARTATKDTNIQRNELKEGSGVVVAPWLIHRHESYWSNPHSFNPSRFEEKERIIKDTYMPFGMGERICIGQGFAIQEAMLILANILRTYKLELQDGFVPDVVGRLTIRSANGMRIKFTKR